MDRLRAILTTISTQLAKLTVTQRLLIASLSVVMLMVMFLVSQYTGSPETKALFPTGAPDEQQKAVAFLNQKGIPYKVAADGRVMLTPEQRYIALAAMTKEQAFPGDKKLMFDGLVTNSSWIKSLTDKQIEQNIALQNELAKVIRAIPGIDDASVFISRPAEQVGLGAHAKKAVAQMTLFPSGGQQLDQGTVNALADLVAGSVSGLDVREVAIIDGKNRRSYRAVSREDIAAGGGTYIEQVAQVEKRLQDKLSEHLRFIPDVIVSVNAIVDAARRESEKKEFLRKGEGSESFTSEESTTNQTSTSKEKSGEPGVGSNVGMNVNQGSTTGSSTSDETSTTKNEIGIGQKITKQRDASGRPTKINVTVSVPREYIVAIIKQGKATTAGGGGIPTPATTTTTEPTDAEISAKFDSDVKAMIEQSVAPLVETEGAGANQGGGPSSLGGQLVAGTVKAFLIPVSMVGSVGGSGGSAIGAGSKVGLFGGGGGSMLNGLIDGGVIKTAMLGVLAVVALGMMLMMVRKAGRAPRLPTAEELVGLPPALEAGTDVVGEAMEGDTAMQGIEIDDDSLKTGKMLEEIGTLVKTNPQTAANVFTRWLNEES